MLTVPMRVEVLGAQDTERGRFQQRLPPFVPLGCQVCGAVLICCHCRADVEVLNRREACLLHLEMAKGEKGEKLTLPTMSVLTFMSRDLDSLTNHLNPA